MVDPQAIDDCAAALHRALHMPAGEQAMRMRAMRSIVKEFNIYRWAADMLLDAAPIRESRTYPVNDPTAMPQQLSA